MVVIHGEKLVADKTMFFPAKSYSVSNRSSTKRIKMGLELSCLGRVSSRVIAQKCMRDEVEYHLFLIVKIKS